MPCAIRARSTARWSTPISPAGRWTTSSASPSRRFYGESCLGPARPAGCSRWRSGSSATASSRSSGSRHRNIGRSRQSSPPRRPRPSAAVSLPSTARSSTSSTLPMRRAPCGSRQASKAPPSRSPMSRASRSAGIRRRLSPPRPCSRKPRASSASRRATPCSSRSASMKASTLAARARALSPICGPTACRSRRRRSLPAGVRWSASMAATTFPPRRANTRPRPRTRKRRTRQSAPRTSPRRRTPSPATSIAMP